MTIFSDVWCRWVLPIQTSTSSKCFLEILARCFYRSHKVHKVVAEEFLSVQEGEGFEKRRCDGVGNISEFSVTLSE